MEAKESSPYVKARAVLLAEYFSSRNWYVFEGKNNCILFYIPADQVFEYTVDELMEIIVESDFHVVETGLLMSSVTYMFFQHAKLVNEVVVLPMTKYDIYTG
ncbi:hypothetical protein [Pedobacter panaciterrae]